MSVPSKRSSRIPRTNSATHSPNSPNPLRLDTPRPSSPSSKNGNTPSIAGVPLPPFPHVSSPIGTRSPRASRSMAPPMTPPNTFGKLSNITAILPSPTSTPSLARLRTRIGRLGSPVSTPILAFTSRTLTQSSSCAPTSLVTAFEEKVIWGDLADIFHLVCTLSLPEDPLRATLDRSHFDGIYLGSRKMAFISQDFRSLMLEIWHVKYLQMPRFRELISSIPIEIRLEHFLNDGDSPDIPIPIYVGYLNQIRDLARRH